MARSSGRRGSGRKNNNLPKNRESSGLRNLYRSGWETRLGRCAAVSLSVLEVKRLLLLTFEMLMDSRAIRFAGALAPMIFSFVDFGLGFPVALATIYAVRSTMISDRQHARPCYPRRGLRRVALMLLICAILNLATLVLAGFQIDLKTDSLRDIFRASMRFYATRASYKLTLDELQIDLECCGGLAYSDWFSLDWQGFEYVDSEDRQSQAYAERSVPYSCCKKRTMLPCIHVDMKRENVRTINNRGCAIVISGLLLKIVIVGYSMTGLIIFTQIATIVFLIKIIQKIIPEFSVSDCSCYESMCTMRKANLSFSSEECNNPAPKKASRARGGSSKGLQALAQPRKMDRRVRPKQRKINSTTSSCCSSRQSLASLSYSSSSSSSCARLTSSPSGDEARLLPPPLRGSSSKFAPSRQYQQRKQRP